MNVRIHLFHESKQRESIFYTKQTDCGGRACTGISSFFPLPRLNYVLHDLDFKKRLYGLTILFSLWWGTNALTGSKMYVYSLYIIVAPGIPSMQPIWNKIPPSAVIHQGATALVFLCPLVWVAVEDASTFSYYTSTSCSPVFLFIFSCLHFSGWWSTVLQVMKKRSNHHFRCGLQVLVYRLLILIARRNE